MSGRRDLGLAASAAVLCAIVALAVPLDAVRIVAALPLCLILPGYAITVAAFGKEPLPGRQLLALSGGMSLATLALGALVLNYVPGGIRPGSWAVLLVLVVITGVVIAGRRGYAPPLRERPARHRRPRALDAALLLGGALTIAAALVISSTVLPAKNALGFSQLWLLQRPGPVQAVRIGVASEEQHTTSYRLELDLPRQRPRVVAHLSLRPGETRTFHVPVRYKLRRPAKVRALLFRSDHPHVPYRRVFGWLPGSRARP